MNSGTRSFWLEEEIIILHLYYYRSFTLVNSLQQLILYLFRGQIVIDKSYSGPSLPSSMIKPWLHD